MAPNQLIFKMFEINAPIYTCQNVLCVPIIIIGGFSHIQKWYTSMINDLMVSPTFEFRYFIHVVQIHTFGGFGLKALGYEGIHLWCYYLSLLYSTTIPYCIGTWRTNLYSLHFQSFYQCTLRCKSTLYLHVAMIQSLTCIHCVFFHGNYFSLYVLHGFIAYLIWKQCLFST